MNLFSDQIHHPGYGSDNPFSDRDLQLLAWLLALLFFFAPLYPQLSNVQYAFLFRTFLFLLLGIYCYRLGWSAILSQILSRPITIPLILWVLLMSLGTGYSPDPYRAQAKLALWLSIFLLYTLGLVLPFTPTHRRILFRGMVGGAAFAALYALFLQGTGNIHAVQALKQYSLYDPEMQGELLRTLEANRAMGGFANPNHLAGFLVLSIMPLWFLWKEASSGIHRWMYLGISALFWLTIYQTYSRSGMLALILAFILIMGYEIFQRKRRFPSWAISLTVVVLILIGLLTFYFLRDHLLGGRLFTFSTITARFHFFRGGLMILRDHPEFGVGAEGFESFYCTYLRPGDLESRYVHNIILEATLELGIPGLLVLFWLMGAIGKSLIRSIRLFPDQSLLSFTAYSSTVILFALSLVDFHNNLMEMVMIPAYLLGCSTSSTAQKKLNLRISKYIAWILTGGLILAWMLLVFCRFVNEVSRDNAYLLVIDGQTAFAKENYERAVWWDWTDSESWNGLGRIWASLPTPTGRLHNVECMEQSVRWSPHRASLRADYADALLAAGYTDRAVQEMQKAQILFPARPNYHTRLAEYYRLLNRPDKMKEEQEKAEQLTELIKARKL